MSCSLLANVGSSSNLCDLNAMRCHFILFTHEAVVKLQCLNCAIN